MIPINKSGLYLCDRETFEAEFKIDAEEAYNLVENYCDEVRTFYTVEHDFPNSHYELVTFIRENKYRKYYPVSSNDILVYYFCEGSYTVLFMLDESNMRKLIKLKHFI